MPKEKVKFGSKITLYLSDSTIKHLDQLTTNRSAFIERIVDNLVKLDDEAYELHSKHPPIIIREVVTNKDKLYHLELYKVREDEWRFLFTLDITSEINRLINKKV